MEKKLAEFIHRKFQIPVTDGNDKRCTPEEAIARHVAPGMTLYLPCGAALLNPLIRAFWGRKPEFTVITTGITQQMHALLYGGLARKAITSFVGHTYPSPRPCPVLQKPILSGEIEIENWTIRTIIQRLLAAAMGLGFLPTRSLIGSSMADDNGKDFKIVDEPFASNGKIGLLNALEPDLALMHAAAADASGNAIFTYPLIGDTFGAWAARKGVIISAEKIVSTDYIRAHANMVRIPSQSVLAVCEAPFGLHPYGVTQHGLSDFECANFPDYEFQTLINQATNTDADFKAWIEEWILGCRNHDAYLAKLGSKRLLYLRGKADADAWRSETASEVRHIDFDAPPNALEKMAVAGARIIAERCIAQKYSSMLAGIGLANLSAWLGRHLLEDRGHQIDLLAEVGMAGYYPRPSDPTVFSYHNIHSCKFLNNIDTALGYLVGGPTSRCLGILGAGQIDAVGNVNSTLIPKRAFLVGSGGANDVAATAKETFVIMNAGKTRLMPKVPYITFPGDNVSTLVTDVGIFEKRDGQKDFTLTAYIPADTWHNETDAIEAIRGQVGWELKVASALKQIEPPTREELTILRLFDPRGFFIGA